MLRREQFLLLVLTAVFASSSCAEQPFPNEEELTQLKGLLKLKTPPRAPTNAWADSPQAAALGSKIFADPGLSSCGTVACTSCHPAPSFVIQAQYGFGCHARRTLRNPPTLLNVAFRRWLYWDGRKDVLWSHPTLPLLRDFEMNATPELVRDRMQEKYAAEYEALFSTAPKDETDLMRVLANVGKALEAYQRTLIQVDAVFDDDLSRFLAAVETDTAEKDPAHLGLKTYVRTARCIVCHKGPMLSDDSFHNIGVAELGAPDPGRAEGIVEVQNDPLNSASIYSDNRAEGAARLAKLGEENPEDILGAFKTPTLRNITVSAPYMHNGAIETLDEVIAFYDRGGDEDGTFAGKRAESIQKLNLTAEQKQALVELLQSL